MWLYGDEIICKRNTYTYNDQLTKFPITNKIIRSWNKIELQIKAFQTILMEYW